VDVEESSWRRDYPLGLLVNTHCENFIVFPNVGERRYASAGKVQVGNFGEEVKKALKIREREREERFSRLLVFRDHFPVRSEFRSSIMTFSI